MRRISHRCAKECRGENAKGRKQKEEITISASRSELQLLGKRFFDDVGACCLLVGVQDAPAQWVLNAPVVVQFAG